MADRWLATDTRSLSTLIVGRKNLKSIIVAYAHIRSRVALVRFPTRDMTE
jgi:hypothetical protein